MKIKRLLLSPIGLVPAAFQPATAADVRIPVKAPVATPYVPLWTGFYAGVHIGAISDQSKSNAIDPPAGSALCFTNDCSFANKQTATGVLGGLQIGYNFQSGNAVYGFEADISAASAKKSRTGFNPPGVYTWAWTAETGIEALGTARLRLGYAFDRVLVYGTGGLAYGKSRNTFQAGQFAFSGETYAWSDRAGWRAGYAAGGGVEYAFDRNWSVKGEALYYDLGEKDHASRQVRTGFTWNLRDQMSGVVGRVGVNYHFGGNH